MFLSAMPQRRTGTKTFPHFSSFPSRKMDEYSVSLQDALIKGFN